MNFRAKTAVCLLCAISSIPIAAHAKDKPKLILQITVDQLRGDMPTRHLKQLGQGGFRYLLEE
ncbi:MAG: hypothetical protein ACR2O3_00745, partial [Rhizobiaceae bacterium]